MNYDPMYGYNKLKGMMDDPQFRQNPEAMLRAVPPAMLSTIVGALFPQAGRMFSGEMGQQLGQQFPGFMSFFGPSQAQQPAQQPQMGGPQQAQQAQQPPMGGLGQQMGQPDYSGGPSRQMGQPDYRSSQYSYDRPMFGGGGRNSGGGLGSLSSLGGMGSLGGMRGADGGNAMARQFNRRSSYGD